MPAYDREMGDAASVVLEFLDLCASKRVDEAVGLLTDDIEWRNSGFPTLRGPRAVAALRAMESRGISFSADMHHVATTGDVVLTERTDHLGVGRWTASFWVCGTFAVRGGRIALWDDHFAAGNVLLGAARGLAGMLRRG